MFIPTTKEEVTRLGWCQLDVILITGDTYIDSPFTGVAVIGKLLMRHGYRVGIIAQPTMDSDADISRLGEPNLFWGITSGAVDSLVSNYTALKKRRKSDDYTPGGINDRRPDRAVIAYTNLVRRYFKQTAPIVLGGIEASLRRVCHYDYWSNTIRRSILFDAKADYLVYGMGESAIIALSQYLKEKVLSDDEEARSEANGQFIKDRFLRDMDNISPIRISEIRGICYISNAPPVHYTPLAPYSVVSAKTSEGKSAFRDSFLTFYENCDPLTAKGLVQKQDSRYLVQNPPAFPPNTLEMDKIAALDFERDVHPFYKKGGKVKALDTIQFSIATHRGCYGECNFCAIAVHEGRTVSWRSEASILEEVRGFKKHRDFKGIITDVGGPTANMYGFECHKKLEKGACSHKRCLYPTVCKQLHPDHMPHQRLLQKIKASHGIRKAFVASGIRPDLILADTRSGSRYMEQIVEHHVSGQMKLAPEHTEPSVLNLMGKPGTEALMAFKKAFDAISKKVGKKQFLTYYFIAAHPGCTAKDMEAVATFAGQHLQLKPEQVQVFTPTPSTLSTLMYYTGEGFNSKNSIFVEKDMRQKERQKQILTAPPCRGKKRKRKGKRRE